MAAAGGDVVGERGGVGEGRGGGRGRRGTGRGASSCYVTLRAGQPRASCPTCGICISIDSFCPLCGGAAHQKV